MEDPFYIIEPKVKKVPLILSVPHSGVAFPEELKGHYNPNMMAQPDDTDWFVDRLYNFATELGVTIIVAKYSRWVIDLNRDPDSAPLYNDGRIITGLTSNTDFFGNEIYKNESLIPDEIEIERRLKKYYWPYYQKISSLLDERIQEFGKVILWDAHSIRQIVPTIRKEKFPDMILGTVDGKSSDEDYINSTLSSLRKSNFQINYNDPFKGGHITRYFGNPSKNIHALQLEMVKTLYMKDNELDYDESRAGEVQIYLQTTFNTLIEKIRA